jgi:tRNA threonylcarbamoyl adenosine modification protein (Sua5/YciO/YrdC/YwlC family)
MRLEIHPKNPQPRLIQQAVKKLNQGEVIVYPTDSAYALGCHIGDKNSLERLRKIRQVDKNHFFTLVCSNLKELANYAQVDNWVFRLLKANTPGAYTFLLNASHEVPKRLVHPKRRTIGLRIPDNTIALALIESLGEPILSTSLIMPDEQEPLWDPDDIEDKLSPQVDTIIDGGLCGCEPTTVIDLTGATPVILRQGKGSIEPFS